MSSKWASFIAAFCCYSSLGEQSLAYHLPVQSGGMVPVIRLFASCRISSTGKELFAPQVSGSVPASTGNNTQLEDILTRVLMFQHLHADVPEVRSLPWTGTTTRIG